MIHVSICIFISAFTFSSSRSPPRKCCPQRMDTQSALMRIASSRGRKARQQAISEYRRQHPPPREPLWNKVKPRQL